MEMSFQIVKCIPYFGSLICQVLSIDPGLSTGMKEHYIKLENSILRQTALTHEHDVSFNTTSMNFQPSDHVFAHWRR